MGCKPGAHRHNARNECIALRALLKLAYKALRDQKCLIPQELVLWMKAQRAIPITESIPSTLTPDMVEQRLIKEGFDGSEI